MALISETMPPQSPIVRQTIDRVGSVELGSVVLRHDTDTHVGVGHFV